jgi:hypothetical protein
MMKYLFVTCAAFASLLTGNSFAYEVWMGVSCTPGSAAA